MGESKVCDACGVTFPSFERACPLCQRRVAAVPDWKLLTRVAIGCAILIAAGIAAFGVVRWLRTPDPLAENVTVNFNWHRPTADGKGTEVSGIVVNEGDVPLDVWVRVRGYDTEDRVFTDDVIGPIRGVTRGKERTFSHRIEATPFKRFEQDVSMVRKSGE